MSSCTSVCIACENSPCSERTRTASRFSGRNFYEVRDPLCLSQIKLIVEKRPLRKFAGLRHTRADFKATLEQQLHDTGPPCPCNSRTSSPV